MSDEPAVTVNVVSVINGRDKIKHVKFSLCINGYTKPITLKFYRYHDTWLPNTDDVLLLILDYIENDYMYYTLSQKLYYAIVQAFKEYMTVVVPV